MLAVDLASVSHLVVLELEGMFINHFFRSVLKQLEQCIVVAAYT